MFRPWFGSQRPVLGTRGTRLALPDRVTDEVAACLGIPGITAHRAVFADGSVAGTTVLVHGVLGGVGTLAAQLASWGVRQSSGRCAGATTCRGARPGRVAHSVALDDRDPACAIRAHAPDGVDRIVEVAFSDNVDLDAAVAKNQTVVAAYATHDDRPDFPFWPMLFSNITIRLLGSDDFSFEARQRAAADLTAAAQDGALSIAVDATMPLEATAQAHERVDEESREAPVKVD